MSPTLALLLCIGFVAFLLGLERKQSRNLSGALWIPTLWILYCSSRPIGAWVGGVGDIEEGSAIDRWFQLTLMLLSTAVVWRRGYDWRSALRNNTWLVIALGYAAISILWSDDIFVSLKRWTRMGGSIIVAMVVASEPAWRQGLESVLRRMVYILIPFSLLVIKYYPNFGVDYNQWSGERMWVGVTTQKNGLGRLCMISAFFLVWAFIKRHFSKAWPRPAAENVAEGILLGMTLFLLKGPPKDYSATSTAVLFLGVILLLVLKPKFDSSRLNPRFTFAILLGALAIGVALPFVGTGGVAEFTGLLARDSTFTGRTEIWDELVRIGSSHPILGVGYGSFWIHPPLRFTINESHNGYLEVFLELGIVGLILLLGILISFWFRASAALRTQFEIGAFAICFLLMAAFHNITEASFLRSTSHIWTMLVFLMVCIARLEDDSKRSLRRRKMLPHVEETQCGAGLSRG